MTQFTNKEIDLTGTTALVTGGGRGLGRGFARALASSGANVVITSRSAEQLKETVDLISEEGGQALSVPADVADPKQVEDVIANAIDKFGDIHLLVNNAGIPGPMQPLWNSEPEAWWKTLEINLRGPMLFTASLLPTMMALNRGRIINVSSGVISGPGTYLGAYGAAKAALTWWTNCLANELEHYAIPIFAYAPGLVRTAMVDYAEHSSEVDQRIQNRFRTNLEEGRDTPINVTVEKFMLLASGKLDQLTGRFIQVGDDFEWLIAHTDEIITEDLHTLRVRQ